MLNNLYFGHFYFKEQKNFLLYGTVKQLGIRSGEILYETSDTQNQMINNESNNSKHKSEEIKEKFKKKELKNEKLERLKIFYGIFTNSKVEPIDLSLIKYYKCLNRQIIDNNNILNIPYNKNFLNMFQKKLNLINRRELLKKFFIVHLKGIILVKWNMILKNFYYNKYILKLKKNEIYIKIRKKKKNKKKKIKKLRRYKKFIKRSRKLFFKRQKFIKKFKLYELNKNKCHN